jgi:phosphate starvation-inducible membrane PsiE
MQLCALATWHVNTITILYQLRLVFVLFLRQEQFVFVSWLYQAEVQNNKYLVIEDMPITYNLYSAQVYNDLKINLFCCCCLSDTRCKV